MHKVTFEVPVDSINIRKEIKKERYEVKGNLYSKTGTILFPVYKESNNIKYIDIITVNEIERTKGELKDSFEYYYPDIPFYLNVNSSSRSLSFNFRFKRSKDVKALRRILKEFLYFAFRQEVKF